jgi:hypothetical protein
MFVAWCCSLCICSFLFVSLSLFPSDKNEIFDIILAIIILCPICLFFLVFLQGDPFGKWCLYSEANYTSLDSHPPLIGWSLDGPPIYGRYLHVNAPGYNIALDDCGGHAHGSLPYHYHAQVITAYTDAGCTERSVPVGTPYAAYPPGVNKCWKGNISAIPDFWSPRNSIHSRPCCGMTEYYVQTGVTLNTAAAAPAPGPSPSPSPTPTPAPAPSPASSSSSSSSTTGSKTSTASSVSALAGMRIFAAVVMMMVMLIA